MRVGLLPHSCTFRLFVSMWRTEGGVDHGTAYSTLCFICIEGEAGVSKTKTAIERVNESCFRQDEDLLRRCLALGMDVGLIEEGPHSLLVVLQRTARCWPVKFLSFGERMYVGRRPNCRT